MSTTKTMTPEEYKDCANPTKHACAQLLPARKSILGEGMEIRRLLPHRQKRMIGAWCFFDHAGPVDVSQASGVRVGPHPHTGLQTFSWMVNGEILHCDSLGYAQMLRKGEVNLMTAGKGISHSEESPAERSKILQLAQFWIALPETHRFIEPAFEHHADLPRIEKDGATLTVLVGEALGENSSVKVYSPLVGINIESQQATQVTLPLREEFEYGIATLTGSANVGEHELTPGNLLYIGKDNQSLTMDITTASELVLIGGEPMDEPVVLFWNFVARNADEVRDYIRLWHETDYFGTVEGSDGEPLASPELNPNVRLKTP